MRKLVLLGAGELARLAYLGFRDRGDYDIAACTVSAQYLSDASLADLPVVPFERLEETHPPSECDLFVAVGYGRVNRNRAELCAEARARGYTLATYVSPHAIVAPDVELRENTYVFERVVIQPFVTLGRNVIVWSGAVIAHDTSVGDNCFIGPQAAISGNVTIGENCFVGINATIRDGVTIATDCVVGAGAVVKHDTAPGEVYSAPPTQPSERPSWELTSL